MKIGILGGGQLGRMLWEASQSLTADLRLSPVYHESAACPAGKGGAKITVGKIHDLQKLSAFFSDVDSFAIENEFLDIAAIESAWHKSREGRPPDIAIPRPSLEGLRIAQDKLEQKKFFKAHKLPTSEFQEITAEFLTSPEPIHKLHQKFRGFVLKKARMGYDGKGNFAVPWDQNLPWAELKNFCESAFQAGSRVYAEKFVPFRKEVALVSCQSLGGDFGHYPLIETVQRRGVCYLAFRAQNEEAHQKQAAEVARLIAARLHLLGTFAVEFFVTQDGGLLVNEMAPRVHNSGHFSQKAARSSQFEMHLKCYYQKNLDLRDFEAAPAFAMVNFLGPEGVQAPVQRPKNEQIYWYDKESTSPGRKLGHMIGWSQEATKLEPIIAELCATEQAWQESLKA